MLTGGCCRPPTSCLRATRIKRSGASIWVSGWSAWLRHNRPQEISGDRRDVRGPGIPHRRGASPARPWLSTVCGALSDTPGASRSPVARSPSAERDSRERRSDVNVSLPTYPAQSAEPGGTTPSSRWSDVIDQRRSGSVESPADLSTRDSSMPRRQVGLDPAHGCSAPHERGRGGVGLCAALPGRGTASAREDRCQRSAHFARATAHHGRWATTPRILRARRWSAGRRKPFPPGSRTWWQTPHGMWNFPPDPGPY